MLTRSAEKLTCFQNNKRRGRPLSSVLRNGTLRFQRASTTDFRFPGIVPSTIFAGESLGAFVLSKATANLVVCSRPSPRKIGRASCRERVSGSDADVSAEESDVDSPKN